MLAGGRGLAGGPGLAAGPGLAPGQFSNPSHVPLKSVLARGAGVIAGVGFVVGAAIVVGARFVVGAGVEPAEAVVGALRDADGGGAATDGAGAGLAGCVELVTPGGSRRAGAVPGTELVGDVSGALLEHPPANNARATAMGTTILRIGPSPRGRSAISGWLHSSLWFGIADPLATDSSVANSRWRALSGLHHHRSAGGGLTGGGQPATALVCLHVAARKVMSPHTISILTARE